ncbi:Y-family DNA polymerase [Pseudoalteromonas sp. S16_S37]|uniref:Y-family DNA polymerase n=1 Tax=Pseudoalteromonas sp. S16_S37 TaxID=2720228 RepID=UPI001680D55E|nr:DNA polymerase Y family protein [Pseudoalteromonas sp. S16_S37]MBD1581436.1 DNA polymerase Y family protein [Pseudoalteromonas sp. S16_S37]
MTLWLYIHFEHLQLDSLLSEQSNLAIVVVNSHTNQVMQASHRALQAGIKLEMGLASAASLCENLQVVAYDAFLENAKLEEIASWLYLVTADISLFPPNGVVLKVTNMLSLYKSLDSYWQHVQNHLADLKLSYRFATGYSVLGAKLLAQGNKNLVTDNIQALMQEIKTFNLQSTELSQSTCEKLQRVRITTVAQLLDIPIADLAKRFDIELVQYIGRLKGELQHPLTYYVPALVFSRQLTLLYELENLQWLAKPLDKLLQQLELFLRRRNKLAMQIILELQLRDEQPILLQVATAQGEGSAQAWQSLLELKLSNINLSAPVQAITLSVKDFLDNRYESQSFFEQTSGGINAAELIARLQAKLGEQTVSGFEVYADLRPERSFFTSQPLPESAKLQRRPKQQRPSMLLPYAVPLQEKISIYWGPERVCTGWWDNYIVERDYYIARNEQGQWLWVYKESSQRWFVHGLFC